MIQLRTNNCSHSAISSHPFPRHEVPLERVPGATGPLGHLVNAEDPVPRVEVGQLAHDRVGAPVSPRVLAQPEIAEKVVPVKRPMR